MMLPRLVYQMCVNGALIVGSVAKKLAGHEGIEPGDYDLLVPADKWPIVSLLIPEDAKLNKFGGWRFYTEEHGTKEMVEVDVWPDTLERYLSTCKSKYDDGVVAVDYINNRVYTSTFLKED